jgi:hypothetical protein
VVDQVVQQLGSGHVDLVADGHEPSDAQARVGCQSGELETELSGLGDDRQAAGGERSPCQL